MNPNCSNPLCPICFCHKCHKTKCNCICKSWKKKMCYCPICLCSICFQPQSHCVCHRIWTIFEKKWKNNKRLLWFDWTLSNELFNATLRVQRSLVCNLRMSKLHQNQTLVSMQTLAIMYLTYTHYHDCRDPSCSICYCQVCGMYRSDCKNPFHK